MVKVLIKKIYTCHKSKKVKTTCFKMLICHCIRGKEHVRNDKIKLEHVVDARFTQVGKLRSVLKKKN